MPESINDKAITNTILASLLTGVYDVNRCELLKINDFGIIEKWYNSVVKLKIPAIVFHNSFSKEITEKYTNQYIQFIEVEYDQKFNPNVFRYFIYQNYLKQHFSQIKNIFITDITDVEVVMNPFESNFFQKNDGYLFCGDEPKILNNDWMINHCSHLRNLVSGFTLYETLNEQKTLLNCGVIGGNKNVMNLLLDKIVAMHQTYSYNNTTASTLDMGVFNYVARTIFDNNILHGQPVNTTFKKYETDRNDCWFRHK